MNSISTRLKFHIRICWADFRVSPYSTRLNHSVTLPKCVLFPRDKARTRFHSREVAIIFRQNALNNAKRGANRQRMASTFS